MLQHTFDNLSKTITNKTLATNNKKFTFIDLFAGIGGIRLGFENIGGKCVFSSEWNKFSNQTYSENFEDNHKIIGDIVSFPAKEVPDHDILLAGFPCQPFSIAGVSKKNSLGMPHGFLCDTQGTLFFDVARIIAEKQPKAFLLENVKNLVSHDRGKTFKTILNVLKNELNYNLFYRVIDGRLYTPQHRERIIIVGFKDKVAFEFPLNFTGQQKHTLKEILHQTDGSELLIEHDNNKYFDYNQNKVQDKYTLTPKLWAYLQEYSIKHKNAGNGFGYGLVTENDVSRTLSARYYKDGSEILIKQHQKNPRRLTPRECARLMGFPDTFKIPVSDTQAYRQFGNSVVVPVIEAVAKLMLPFISTGLQNNHIFKN